MKSARTLTGKWGQGDSLFYFEQCLTNRQDVGGTWSEMPPGWRHHNLHNHSKLAVSPSLLVDHKIDVTQDPYHEREANRLRAQLKSGCHVRIYHHGESPSHVYSGTNPSAASQVRHEIAQSLLDQSELMLVEKGWNFDVYELAA